MPSMTNSPNASERILLLVQLPGDAALATGILARAGLQVERCSNLTELNDAISQGAGVVVIAHDIQDFSDLMSRLEVLERQPLWSAIPVIMIVQPSPGADLSNSKAYETPQRVIVLERPLRVASFVSTVQMALQERRQQYRIRDLLAERTAEVQQRDHFLAMLSHELRNPLAAIVNAATVLELMPAAGPEEKAVRNIIVRQASQMKRLVDDMLDVARLTRGKLRVARRPLDLTRLLRELVEEMRPGLERRGKVLEISLPDRPLPVLGDDVRLRQVFGNVLTNAAKYTHGNGHITISADQAGISAQVRVGDDGMGMTQEMLARLFKPFAQAETTVHLSEGGLGLGLYLAHRLVALHGGEISAASQGPGQGSEFVVKLPLTHQQARRQAPAMTADPADRTQRPGARKRVLLVEDNVDSAAGLRLVLMEAGYEVHVANDGSAALKAAAKCHPDAVVLDIGLPDINGYEVAYQLRHQLKLGNIPIIALSGYGSETYRQCSSDAGIDRYLIKPASLADLEQALACRDNEG